MTDFRLTKDEAARPQLVKLLDAFGQGILERAQRVDRMRAVLENSDPIVARGLEIERAQDFVALRQATAAFKAGVADQFSLTPAAPEAQVEVARLAGKWSTVEPAVDIEIRRADDLVYDINALHDFNGHDWHVPVASVAEADRVSWEGMDARSGNKSFSWTDVESKYAFHEAAATLEKEEHEPKISKDQRPPASAHNSLAERIETEASKRQSGQHPEKHTTNNTRRSR